jgi:diguanylate cyclase (GGDEF)-like protein
MISSPSKRTLRLNIAIGITSFILLILFVSAFLLPQLGLAFFSQTLGFAALAVIFSAQLFFLQYLILGKRRPKHREDRRLESKSSSSSPIHPNSKLGVEFAKLSTSNEALPEKPKIPNEVVLTNEKEEVFADLREIEEIFGSSLKLPDAFRLAADRFNALCPYSVCVLFLLDETRQKLAAFQAVGDKADLFEGVILDCDKGIAGECVTTRSTILDQNLSFESAQRANFFGSALAVPLLQEHEVYGALVFYSEKDVNYSAETIPMVESIRESVETLFWRSLITERNQINALTDVLTQLPNERAFYLVLEQQIAECQRFLGSRALTIVSLDLANFADINAIHGHLAGDALLCDVGDCIKSQLRQMDFLARSVGDEFLMILPTVTADLAPQVVDRIEKAITNHSFTLTDGNAVKVRINLGMSSFLNDGENARNLCLTAIARKQRQKNPTATASVISFPLQRVRVSSEESKESNLANGNSSLVS